MFVRHISKRCHKAPILCSLSALMLTIESWITRRKSFSVCVHISSHGNWRLCISQKLCLVVLLAKQFLLPIWKSAKQQLNTFCSGKTGGGQLGSGHKVVTDACAATSSESEQFIIDSWRFFGGIGNQLVQGESLGSMNVFRKDKFSAKGFPET